MKYRLSIFLILYSSTLFGSSATDWPHWRGPYGNGIAEAEGLPVTWDETRNISWKSELPSWSGSSPIVFADRVFVISPSKEKPREKPIEALAELRERRRPTPPTSIMGPGGQEIMLHCLSRENGRSIWNFKLDEGNEIALKQNRSTPSPVARDNRVWTVTGNGVVSSLDFAGNLLWRYDMDATYGVFGLGTGYASSPILYKDLLILQVLRGRHTDDPSYILALDARTGEEVYYHERWTDAEHESPDSYTTPAISKSNNGDLLIITGGDYVTAHDPRTGEEIWRAAGLNPKKAKNYRIIPSPVAVDGMIYAPTRKTPLLALRADGEADVTESHLVWKWEKPSGSPDVPTPISDGKYFYMVDDFGLVTCLDAKTGATVYGPESTDLGRISASPTLADGKIYIVSEDAEVAVVKAGPEFKLLGKSQLQGGFTLSTPAAAGNQLFFRTGEYLYCISKR